MTKLRRLACVCLTAVMSASLAASQSLAFADTGRNAPSLDTATLEDVTGKMDFSSVQLKNLNKSVLDKAGLTSSGTSYDANTVYTVIVELSGESVIDLTDSAEAIPEYIASFKGSRKLKSIKRSHENFLARLSSAGIGYKYINGYTTVANAVALKVNSSDFKKLAKMDGVENVVLSSTYAYPEAVKSNGSTDVAENPNDVYATGIYKSEGIIEQYGVDGSGMTVAILDTGLDYSHAAFQTMPEEDTLGLTKSEVASLLASKNFDSEILYPNGGKTLTVDDVYVNAKVPYAYDYADGDADVYPSYSNHGTHVAGIVAGQADSYTDKDGNIAKDAEGNVLSFRGVAPNAQLVICKVFTDDFDSEELGGATTENILAALDDCVNLGVDVINMSLGTSGGFSSITIDDETKGLNDTEGKWMNEVYGKVKKEGISLICAASNDYSSGYGSAFGTNLASNPDSSTVGSPSTYDGAISVASINGQLARYMTVETKDGSATKINPIYYLDSSNENSVQYDFLKQMGELVSGGINTTKVKYVVIPGRGENSDYTTQIQKELNDKSKGPVIAVINRGKSTFKDKIQLAMDMNADAAILVNNVAGSIRVSLGDLEEPIPTVSVTMDAGTLLLRAANNRVGYITLDEKYQAGPFMNDYSSWGVTPDLKIKPDITAHGGEITSSVPGGYDEQSGTSMASPNLAGFVALLRSHLKGQENFKDLNSVQLTTLVNQIFMSTAVIVYDQDILPYSPRKQGAGLASLNNSFGTKAYLYTEERRVNGVTYCEDGRPKYELGEDKEKKGEYTVSFYVNNFGEQDLTFSLNSIFMTETLSSDNLSVAEKAHIFGDIPAKWVVGASEYNEGDIITVSKGASNVKISVTLTMSQAEKNYIDSCFTNGMFVEGFISLKSQTEGQCDLSLPYLGFYGDWRSAPMLDYNCYEISDFEQDTSLLEEERPHEQVWATQAFAEYFNGDYRVPMGGFAYLQDENADQIYVEEEYAAVSCFNIYNGESEPSNYLTTYSVKALYAGLLRNAEVVSYTLYNDETGEELKSDYVYRVRKSISNGGSPIPSNVEINLSPSELGLVSNGKYRLEFNFYFDADDVGNEDAVSEDNTFSMIFYADYEAPVLTDARVRYYDYKESNKDKQRVYLDVDVYDNHYAQSIILCYINENHPEELVMATKYVTPVYNAVKNGVTTVSIEITEFYEKYKDSLYIQVDDYALNHSVYRLTLSSSQSPSLPSTFEIAEGSEMTLGINENYKLNLKYSGTASLSDFKWGVSNGRVKIKNGEIFGVSAGRSTVTVSNGTVTKRITVNVVDKNIKNVTLNSLSFGLIETAQDGLHNAVGTVNVYAGKTYQLEIVPDPWYYPVEKLNFKWESDDPEVASVDQNGNVTTYGKGPANISAKAGTSLSSTATVTFNVLDPFRVSNFVLVDYKGPGGTVVIPDDENIMYIGEEAFEQDTSIEYVIIPETVREIRKRAFQGCTNLKGIYLVSKEAQQIPNAKLSVVLEDAFEGCTSLEFVDLTNAKVLTLGRRAFANCTSLQEVKKMQAIGTMNEYAFAGCTALESVDISNLHSAGTGVFLDCTALTSVTTDYYTSLGESMFEGCTALSGKVVINTPVIAAGAFAGCVSLSEVDFGGGSSRELTFNIGAQAFDGCENLEKVTFGKHGLSALGDMAFANCKKLTNIQLPAGDIRFGDRVFYNTPIKLGDTGTLVTDEYGALYSGDKLVLAPKIITADFAFKAGVTEIGEHAFTDSVLSGVTSITVPETVTKIAEGAFAHLQATSIILPDGIKEIPDYAFFGCSLLASVTIPRETVKIGLSAFEGCISLNEVIFDGELKEIGDRAFALCQKLTSVVIPSSVETMGGYVFVNCSSLTEVNLPALKSLGDYTFYGCINLRTAVFDSNATTVGNFTFFPGGDEHGIYSSSLVSVTLPDAVETLGEGVFNYCNKLVSVDLKHVTKVGAYAFARCGSLKTVTGLENLTEIGDYAFTESGLTSLALNAAVNVGSYAFYNVKTSSIILGNVENIGSFAFYGGMEAVVQLPASLKSVGSAAFTSSPNLRNVNVSADSALFFTEDGVLYRNVYNTATGKTGYELVVYPAARASETFTVKDGTVTIGAYAFAETNEKISTVNLPRSLKAIGAYAFYASGIKTYVFEAVTAPALLTEVYDNSALSETMIATGVFRIQNYFYSMYYTNFEDEFILYSHLLDPAYRQKSELKIVYPENATGYDGYVYSNYFGSAEKGGEVIDDTTLGMKNILDDYIAEYGDVVNTVKGWNSLEVNAENTALVQSFSDGIKEAHRLYNQIKGEKQLELLDEGKESGYYYNLLSSVETELKSVKQRFGIKVKADRLLINSDSTHKTQYKAGESFDMSGLKLTVVYDDYSSELADMTKISLSPEYAGALDESNRYVVLLGYEKRLEVAITVTAGDNGNGNDDKKSGCAGGCGSTSFGGAGGSGLMALGILAITFAGAVVIRRKRQNNSH